jgi:pimeloyl-ACP methyl ester carboxylesterase
VLVTLLFVDNARQKIEFGATHTSNDGTGYAYDFIIAGIVCAAIAGLALWRLQRVLLELRHERTKPLHRQPTGLATVAGVDDVEEGTIERPDGRQVGYADFGPASGTPVLWCHGGPGCRLDPAYLADEAASGGLRLIGIDRPGYGWSDPDPGRTIAGWVADALAVADHLGIDRFATVGLSTGGAYALALAALAPDRVIAAVPCGAMTDMRHEDARATMSRPHALAVWEAPDRDAAIAASVASHGIDGSKIVESAEGPPLPSSDQAMLPSRWGQLWMQATPTMFAHGLEGYADDRIADGGGWVTFDVTAIRCPVIVLHGGADVIADPIHACGTADLVPGAELRIVDGLGHFSIEDELVAAVVDAVSAT